MKYFVAVIALLITIYLPIHFVYALNGDTPFVLFPLHFVMTAVSIAFAMDYISRNKEVKS